MSLHHVRADMSLSRTYHSLRHARAGMLLRHTKNFQSTDSRTEVPRRTHEHRDERADLYL